MSLSHGSSAIIYGKNNGQHLRLCSLKVGLKWRLQRQTEQGSWRVTQGEGGGNIGGVQVNKTSSFNKQVTSSTRLELIENNKLHGAACHRSVHLAH